jgi:hypothetical protein
MLAPLLDLHYRSRDKDPVDILCPRVTVRSLADALRVAVVGLASPRVAVAGLASPRVSVTGLAEPRASVSGLADPRVTVTGLGNPISVEINKC